MATPIPGVTYTRTPGTWNWLAPGHPDQIVVNRDSALWPWAPDAMQNVSIGSGAIYEAATTGTATQQFRAQSAEFNYDRWSVSIQIATPTNSSLCHVTSQASSKTWDIYIPDDAQTTPGYDGHMTMIQRNGYTSYEGYAMQNLGGGNWQTMFDLITQDLRGNGLRAGMKASNIAQITGIIRPQELADLSIPHTLVIGLPAVALKKVNTSADGLPGGPNSSKTKPDGTVVAGNMWVWPANGADNPLNSDYSGKTPMGALYAIHPSVNLTTLGLSPEGLAVGRALQDFGGHVLITAATCAIYGDPKCNAAAAVRARADWKTKLFPLMQRITNNDPGPVDATTRVPLTPDSISGGGVRRRPFAPPLA